MRFRPDWYSDRYTLGDQSGCALHHSDEENLVQGKRLDLAVNVQSGAEVHRTGPFVTVDNQSIILALGLDLDGVDQPVLAIVSEPNVMSVGNGLFEDVIHTELPDLKLLIQGSNDIDVICIPRWLDQDYWGDLRDKENRLRIMLRTGVFPGVA